MESYSSGRRGVPAKDVGVPAREGSNPSLSAKQNTTKYSSDFIYYVLNIEVSDILGTI